MVKTKDQKLTVLDMAYIALFAVIIAVCSWISIPATVPFTLQTFAVFAAIGILGGKRGTLSVLVYLLLGAIGVPVFAGFSGGLGALFGMTGGYLFGFLFSALAMWLIERFFGNKTPVLLASMLVGLLVCYILGTAWFMLVYTKNNGSITLLSTLSMCVFPFIIPDCIKIALSLLVSKKLAPVLKKFSNKNKSKKSSNANV